MNELLNESGWSPNTRVAVLPDVENHAILRSFVSKCDRQTDGQINDAACS